jgi:hypothetical protein
MSLPAEVWTRIFELAADDDILFRPGIPTSLTESAWYQDYNWKNYPALEWKLRSPEQAMDVLQRRSYATKKVSLPSPNSNSFLYLTCPSSGNRLCM